MNHKKFILVFFVFEFMAIAIIQGENILKCDYTSSIDISSGVLNANRSISYNGKLYKYGLYSMVNFKYENGQRKKVKAYARACVYEDHLPCKFSESIKITEAIHDQKNVVRFDYMEFPEGTYAYVSYDYRITSKEILNYKNESIQVDYFERINTSAYLRGCVCNRKPCIRFCCTSPYQLVENGRCGNLIHKNIELPIRNSNNMLSISNFEYYFYYVTKRQCSRVTFSAEIFEINFVRLFNTI